MLDKRITYATSVVTLVGAIGAGIWALEARYASAKELDKTKQFIKYSFEEVRLDRVNDKLEELLIIKEEDRTDHEKAEIIRLRNLQEKIYSRLEKEYEE